LEESQRIARSNQRELQGFKKSSRTQAHDGWPANLEGEKRPFSKEKYGGATMTARAARKYPAAASGRRCLPSVGIGEEAQHAGQLLRLLSNQSTSAKKRGANSCRGGRPPHSKKLRRTCHKAAEHSGFDPCGAIKKLSQHGQKRSGGGRKGSSSRELLK